MLELASTEPKWLGSLPSDDPEDPRPFFLPGVRVEFEPIGIKAVRAAREAVRVALNLHPDDPVEAGDALSREIIRRGVRRWEGVFLAGTKEEVPATKDIPLLDDAGQPVLDADGKPVVTLGTISAFVAMPRAFEEADSLYVWPWVRKDLEGNVFAGSVNGTGAAGTPASDIVASPVKPRRKAAAGRTRKRNRKVAPTG